MWEENSDDAKSRSFRERVLHNISGNTEYCDAVELYQWLVYRFVVVVDRW